MVNRYIILFLLLVIFVIPQKAFAEKIDSFDIKVTAHKDGTMDIVESINYDFEDLQRHGIFRYIPLYTKVGDLYRIIKVNEIQVQRDGKREKYEKSGSSDQLYLKIGNPDSTLNGVHKYTITYKVLNGIGSNFSTHDEIYWNGTGNGWEVPILQSTIKIANDFDVKSKKIICFTGTVGSNNSNCSVSENIVKANKVLNSGEGLTAVFTYPRGTFPPSLLSKSPPQSFADKLFKLIADNYIFIWVFINIVLVGIIIFWFQKHKNKKRFGKPVVNFDIPKDDNGNRVVPALAGIIDSAKLERDDVVATLFDLAIRKYLKFENIKTKRTLLPDSNDQKIIKLKDIDNKLNKFEIILFDRLFKNGDEVLVSDLKKDFYKTFNKLEKEAFLILVEQNFYIKNPKTQKMLLILFAFIAFFTFNLILSGVLFFLARKLIGRTQFGDEVDFRIDGLKLFLKSMNRNYKWQAEKFYIVEQMIPYAVSLGYIEKFMEQLKIINPDYDPSWYGGHKGSFYLAYGAFYSSMNSSITTVSPSSSGAGGGGFSGGGGGGGGGGSW